MGCEKGLKRGREEAGAPGSVSRPRLDHSVPRDWIDCPRYGDLIAGAIIPSKVPLNDAFTEAIPPGKRYGLKRLPRQVQLIIDLTNTNKYYSPSELNVKHIKIACKGRDEVPHPACVEEFMSEVHSFISSHANRGFKILVHCTHGFNRTGFMIVNYLMRYRGYSLGEAVEEFTKARPPGIYKPSYLRSLYEQHGEEFQPSLVPLLPAWKSPEELEAEVVQAEAPKPADQQKLVPYEQRKLQQLCLALLDETTKHGNSFPGSHPVSLDRRKMQALRQKYYLVGSKADGTRYMMLLLRQGCYLIDRSFKFQRVELRFPNKDLRSVHHGTLVDGEMVTDGSQQRFLIFDVMALNFEKLHKKRFLERWALIMPEIVFPRQQERGKQAEPFGVRRKEFYVLSAANKLANRISQTGIHECDGFIFQAADEPYVCGADPGLLKWKFPHMNSVDFLLKKSPQTGEYVLVLGGGRVVEGDRGRVIFPEGVHPSSFEDQVIECFWKAEKSSWEFMRPRPDKGNQPNGYWTFNAIWESIRDNITMDELLEAIRSTTSLPLYTDRTPRIIDELLRPSKVCARPPSSNLDLNLPRCQPEIKSPPDSIGC